MGINMLNDTKEKWGVAESLRKNPIFVPFFFGVFDLVLCIHVLVCEKYTLNAIKIFFYLSLTIFFLNAITVNIMLVIINIIIEIKPKPATLLKE